MTLAVGTCYECLEDNLRGEGQITCIHCRSRSGPGYSAFMATVHSRGKCYLCGSFQEDLKDMRRELKICEVCKPLVSE